MIAVFVLLLMMGVAMMAYLYWWRQQQGKAPTPLPPRLSIADLHGRCIENPLNCEIEQTTIEEADEPEYYEKEYGFKTNLQKMKQALKDEGTCEDDECPEIKALEAKTRKISQDAIRDSMNHCKLRLPGDRLRRSTYDARGKEIGREETPMLGLRNEYINMYVEPELDKMMEGPLPTYRRYEEFLEAYGAKRGTGAHGVGGITDCDFYVEGCAVGESDVCHPDAIRKHKDVLKKRPPIKRIPEKDYAKALADSGLMVDDNGEVILSVTNQTIMDNASDEEKQKIKDAFAESMRVQRWWQVDLDEDGHLSSEEFANRIGADDAHASDIYVGGFDYDGDGRVGMDDYFKFADDRCGYIPSVSSPSIIQGSFTVEPRTEMREKEVEYGIYPQYSIHLDHDAPQSDIWYLHQGTDPKADRETCFKKCNDDPECRGLTFNKDKTACWGKRKYFRYSTIPDTNRDLYFKDHELRCPT